MSSQAPDPFQVTPLTEDQTLRVESEIKRWSGELEDEFGPYRMERLPTGRVLLLPQQGIPHVLYMSDDGPDARLCCDDYVPEIGDPTLDQSRPSNDQ